MLKESPLFRFCLAIFVLMMACKSQQPIVEEAGPLRETGSDIQGNPNSEYHLNFFIQGPSIPEGKWFYMYVPIKKGVYLNRGTNQMEIEISDHKSPDYSAINLVIPASTAGRYTLVEGDQSLRARLVFEYKNKQHNCVFQGGFVDILEASFTEGGLINGQFNSYVMLDGESHLINGVFLLPSEPRQ